MIALLTALSTLALSSAEGLQAQDEPWETHLYNVEFLTREVGDFAGDDFSLAQDAIGAQVAKSDFGRGILTGTDIVSLIKSNVAEDTWEHERAAIAYAEGVLTVTNKKSVHEKIRQYLAYWRGFFGKMITMDAAIVSVDPVFFARLRSAGNPERPMVLPPEHAKQLFDAAREGKNAELLKSMRLTAHPGQRVNLKDAQRQDYVRDYDVQIATASLALDPILDVLDTGISFDLRPYLEPFGNAVTVEIRATRAEPEGLTERKLKLVREIQTAGFSQVPDGEETKTAVEARRPAAVPATEAKVELPKLALDRLRSTLTIRAKETSIVGSTFRGGRQVVFLLTASIIAVDEQPAPEPAFEEQRLLRLFDVSPLTRGVQDFAGPRIGLVSPSAGGGLLVGASFTLNEPAVMMGPESVVSMLKSRVAPDSWGNKRNTIGVGPNGALFVKQRPEVLREIEQVLSSLIFARAQMISVEAAVIGIKRTARAAWEQEIPALGPGGYFVEKEKFDKLFEEAAKGAGVRLVETAEVACFPQQRVNVLRVLQENRVADYEPQVAMAAMAYDPIIDMMSSGFVLDVRPHFVHGQEHIAVDLRAQWVGNVAARDIDAGAPHAAPLQGVKADQARWEADVLCAKGRWTLVGLQSRGKGDDAEEVALFLRARHNVLK